MIKTTILTINEIFNNYFIFIIKIILNKIMKYALHLLQVILYLNVIDYTWIEVNPASLAIF